MKTDGNDPAQPLSAEVLENIRKGHYQNAGETPPFGLTKREHFAAMAMQGISGLSTWPGTSEKSAKEKAEFAVKLADSLIKALNEISC